MKKIKNKLTHLAFCTLVIIVMSGSSGCKKDKDDDNNTGSKQYVPSQIVISSTGTTTPLFTINYTYNTARQITRMVQNESGDVTTWDFTYLSNGSLDRLNYINGSDNGVINFTYGSDNRLSSFQEVAGGSTTDYNVSHTNSTNTYSITTTGSTSALEIDLDASDNMEELRGSLAGDIELIYLTDQKGVFDNVQLTPSVLIPFHLIGSYIHYYMQPYQITQMTTSGAGAIPFSNQLRDSNGNLTSFRINGGGIDETFTVTYELK